MVERIGQIVVGLAVLVLAVNTAQALDPPHDANNSISCDNCHAMHTILIPRGAEQKSLCETCHNETDPNAGHLSDVNNHPVNGGATIIDCGSCHDPHGPHTTTDPHSGGQTAVNLRLIRSDTSKYVTDACEPAIFQQRPAHFAFGSSNPPWDGICQSCHTYNAGTMTRHTKDGLGDNDHGIGSNCISCHSHQDGFAASGCTGCHEIAQDNSDGPPTRRAVVGEFALTSHHVAGGAVTDDDCAVCHYEAVDDDYHKDNIVHLRNPDDANEAAVIDINSTDGTFTRDTSSDALELWVTDVQDNFCLKCHDADGATATAFDINTPRQPFSYIDANVPNVFDRFDTANSFHHAVRGAGNNPYCIPSATNGNNITMESPWNQDSTHDVVSCFDCHVANGHGDPNQGMLLGVIDFNSMESTTDSADLPSGMGATVEAFCTTCHKASVYVSSNDPESVGSIFEYHGSAQNQHGAAGGNELGCMGCHGGIVDFSTLSDGNGSARGNIHGGNLTWPASSWADGSSTEHFILGGWNSGWKINTSAGNNGCGGGDCNHTGSVKRHTPGKEYTN
jgi:hypothetical protein